MSTVTSGSDESDLSIAYGGWFQPGFPALIPARADAMWSGELPARLGRKDPPFCEGTI